MSTEPFRRVAPDFYVAPQLTAEDFASARTLGIRTVINNRPDGEAPDQLSNADAARAAAAAGLRFVHVPVVSGGIFPDHIAAIREAVDGHDGPYLAYCRSGTRSCFLWGFVAARNQSADDILQAAAAAGYDLGPVYATLERIHREYQKP